MSPGAYGCIDPTWVPGGLDDPSDRARDFPEFRDLVQALGPLVDHVQLLTATPAGFMARLHRDTPRPALEAILTEFDRHAVNRHTQTRATPAPKPRKPRPRKKPPGQSTPPAPDPGSATAA